VKLPAVVSKRRTTKLSAVSWRKISAQLAATVFNTENIAMKLKRHVNSKAA
jgi:hypothetical protein